MHLDDIVSTRAKMDVLDDNWTVSYPLVKMNRVTYDYAVELTHELRAK